MADNDTPSPLRVLLLEDDPNDAALIQLRLEESHYQVSLQIAHTRADFISFLNPQLDVILSDHAMPQFDALQALEIVKQAELDIPFIIVSGTIKEEIAVEAMRMGAADYLLKDRLTRLAPAIEQALREKQLRAEKERVFEAIRESEARYRLLAEHATDVIARIAPDGTCLYISPSSRDMLGYDPAELIGDDLFEKVHPDDQSQLRLRLSQYEHDAAERATFRMRRKNGSDVWIEATGNVIWDQAKGEIKEVVSVMRDVTERQKAFDALTEAKERAEEMARLKSSFLTNMSHEIRTPLTSIIGFSDILADETTGPTRKMAEYIRGGGERLLMTLDSVLDLAQLESNSLQLWPQQLDLVDEIEQVSQLMKSQADEKGLCFRFVHEDPHLPAVMDRGALSRILTNIIGNAVKFTESGGISVSLERTNDQVQIVVADSGIGIGPDFMTRVFNEFQQESQGVSRGYEGVGLGLSITRRILDIMGGAIEIESELNVGTTVSLRIPLKVDVVEMPAVRLRS